MERISLKGVVDLHVHSQPDIRERAYNDFELLDAGVKAGAKAIVIKSHHGFTMNRAYLANEYNRRVNKGDNDFVMYGGITLNKAIGGLNPVAVETGLKMGGKIVWLPTTHASNDMAKNGKSGGIECVKDGKVVPELNEILNLVKEYDVVLGTGHLSPEEIFVVVDHAKNMGIDKILINHPEFWIVGMTHEEQIKIVKDYDVYLERCYAQPLGGGKYKSNLSDNLEIINKIGEKNIVVDTDGGQVENPNWEIAFEEYINYLFDNGITKEQLEVMTIKNASKLLNI
ncbi:MAG: DUF6282 family protein [Arcanobacterium sp.]